MILWDYSKSYNFAVTNHIAMIKIDIVTSCVPEGYVPSNGESASYKLLSTRPFRRQRLLAVV